MKKIRILETDEVIEVKNNKAFDLIDAGVAELYSIKQVKPKKRRRSYRTK